MNSHTRALITGCVFLALVVALELLQNRSAPRTDTGGPPDADAVTAPAGPMAKDPGKG